MLILHLIIPFWEFNFSSLTVSFMYMTNFCHFTPLVAFVIPLLLNPSHEAFLLLSCLLRYVTPGFSSVSCINMSRKLVT